MFLKHSLSSWTRRCFNDRLRGWQLDLRIGLLAFCISLLFAFPSLWQWLAGDPNRINEFLAQAHNPWRRDLTEPILYYRFLVPLLNHGIGLRGFWAVLPGIAASFLNLCLLSRLVRERTQNITYSLVVVIGFAFTFFIAEGTTFLCSPDSVAHCFVLLLAVFDVGLIASALMALGSLLVDERSIAALAFLCIFQFHSVSLRRNLSSALRSMPAHFLSLLLALLAWKGIRLCLELGLWSDPVRSQLLAETSSKVLASLQPWDGWAPWMVNALAAFKWVYIYPALLTILVARKIVTSTRLAGPSADPILPAIWSANVCLFAILLIASMFNGDVWRTVSFGYLFCIEAALSLYEMVGPSILTTATVTSVLMVVTPVAYVAPDLSERVAYPMPFVLWRTFFGGKGALSWLLSLIGIHRGGS